MARCTPNSYVGLLPSRARFRSSSRHSLRLGSRADSVFKIERNDQTIASMHSAVLSEKGSYAVEIHAADENTDIIAVAVFSRGVLCSVHG